MRTLIVKFPMLANPIINPNRTRKVGELESPSLSFQFCPHQKIGIRSSGTSGMFSYSNAQSYGGEDSHNSVQELRVPNHWLEPSRASQESEWLRVTLHKWLDEEYCAEDTNIEISRVAANSFYKSLLEKRVDLGEILLKMAVELESISYQESFHGAFSSANAAVNLIMERISQE